MKFAHLADMHIGSWREPKLRELSVKAFIKAMDLCIERNVDFIIISGDLFNTSLPAIENLKTAVKKLKEIKNKNIPVYIIAGSHDFSPSGKTMLDVLEEAGMFINVARGEEKDGKLRLKFTVDPKTGAKITGLLGKKGTLEKGYYDQLDRAPLEKEQGYKIFVFHTALTELKTEELEAMESIPFSLLPKNFNYYAGGHVHDVMEKREKDYGLIAYPGPLFPNSFRELEKLHNGGFYIVEDDKLSYEPIQMCSVLSLMIDCGNKTPEEVNEILLKEIKNKEFNNTIVTIRLEGMLERGKPSSIDFKTIFEKLYEKSAYFVMKNTNKLSSKEFEETKVEVTSVEETEEKLIKEHLGQIKVEGLSLEKETGLIKSLMKILGPEKGEGEKVADFEKRIKEEINKVIEI